MRIARFLFLDRISGQMAVLIVVSLIVIHAVITASIFLAHRDGWRPPDDRPSMIISLVTLIAATPAEQRAHLFADIANAFPHAEIKPASAPPAGDTEAPADLRLRFLHERLGHGFTVTPLQAAEPGHGLDVLIRMPDGTALSARLPTRAGPPAIGGPIAMTILFVVVSVALLGVWATRVLGAPLRNFARAAEGFSLDSAPTALPERGPHEIRTVAKAFNQMRSRIKALVDDRTRMLAAMGHDLRTPITRLRLRSEFLADQSLRGQMLSDLDQMKAMTDGVLSFLRDGERRGGFTAIDVATDLQTICDQFSDVGYDVRYEGPAHATITARPNDLHRAVANLVENAVRHGKHAVVRLRVAPADLCIEVEDDGPGIPDASKAAMLEAFVRGDAARTMDDRSGFGLGLSIAKAIAEAHGGTLTLHDAAPHGLIARLALSADLPRETQTMIAAE